MNNNKNILHLVLSILNIDVMIINIPFKNILQKNNPKKSINGSLTYEYSWCEVGLKSISLSGYAAKQVNF